MSGLASDSSLGLARRLTSATTHLQNVTNAFNTATTAKQQFDQTLVAAKTEGDTLVAARYRLRDLHCVVVRPGAVAPSRISHNRIPESDLNPLSEKSSGLDRGFAVWNRDFDGVSSKSTNCATQRRNSSQMPAFSAKVPLVCFLNSGCLILFVAVM